MANAKEKGALDILSKDNQKFIIPVYQRSYDWEKEDVKRFIDDIYEYHKNSSKEDRKTDDRYYIGNIIVKDKKNSKDSDITDVILIDGQQRITTIFLILIAISNLKEDKKRKIEKYFRVDDGGEEVKDKFKINRYRDSNLIEKLKNDFENITTDDKNTNVWKHYDFIEKYLKETISPDELFQALKDSTFLVRVKANNDDEHKIFETINSTGKKLTPSDLIKNYILFGSANWNEKEENGIISLYENIESLIKKENFDSFFRYFNTIIKKIPLAKKGSNKIFLNFKEIFNSENPSDFIDYFNFRKYSSVKKLINRIIKHAKIFNELHFYKSKNDNMESKFYGENFLTKENTYYVIAHELLFYSEEEEWETNVDDIMKFISHWCVLRAIGDYQDKNITRDVPNIYANYNKWKKEKLIEKSSLKNFKKYLLSNEKNYKIPSKDEVQKEIKYNKVYKKNKKNTAMILKYFELSISDKFKNNVDILNPKISIEHIFPQNNKLWEEGLKDDYLKTMNLEHTIGNLTLLTIAANSSIGNKTFKNKKSIFKNDTLIMNQEFEGLEKWDHNNIKERSNKIFNSIIKFIEFY